jgi:hypothetical protein
MITIKLKDGLKGAEEQWLAKNIGPRMHYIHNSIGGQGWIAKRQLQEVDRYSSDGEKFTSMTHQWFLTLEDERFATFFLIKFPQ